MHDVTSKLDKNHDTFYRKHVLAVLTAIVSATNYRFVYISKQMCMVEELSIQKTKQLTITF